MAGRPKGSKNFRSFDAEILAKETGIDPLRLTFYVAAGKWKEAGFEEEYIYVERPDGSTKSRPVITPEMRLEAMKCGCKYLYSAKQSAELSVPEGIKIILEDYSKK